MKSTRLHEQRRMGELIGLNGTLIGCAGLEPYSIFDTPPTCGPGIADPSQACPIGKTFAYYSYANGWDFVPTDYFNVTGFAQNSDRRLLPVTSVTPKLIQSPTFSTPVNSSIYIRYKYNVEFTTASSLLTCCVNWGRARVTPFLTMGQAYTADAVQLASNLTGGALYGAPDIDVDTEYIFEHLITVGTLIAGTNYNFTSNSKATRTSDNVVMFNTPGVGTFDAIGASNFNWEFYYASTAVNRLEILDLYMVGTGFPNNCSG